MKKMILLCFLHLISFALKCTYSTVGSFNRNNKFLFFPPSRYEGVLTFLHPTQIEFRHQGSLDAEGRFTGYTILRLVDKEACVRGQCGSPAFMRVAGHFVEGVLQGPVTLISRDER